MLCRPLFDNSLLSDEETPYNHQSSNEITAIEFSPLEALRHQLKTLDELEEQFPVSSVTDAYLRYPFSDSGWSPPPPKKALIQRCHSTFLLRMICE